jgi:L-lysine exporter family protein LysE/ArgO
MPAIISKTDLVSIRSNILDGLRSETQHRAMSSWIAPAVWQSAAGGFLLCAGLIVAIGAQNAYLLRMGLVRLHVTPLALTAALLDAALIAAGLFGVGLLIEQHRGLAEGLRWCSAAFLAAYALGAARRAWRGSSATERGTSAAGASPLRSVPVQAQAVPSLRRSIATLLAFSLLNPHVYVDTVLLIGAVGSPLPWPQRVGFGAGAAMASALWFFGLGHGARLLAPLLATRRAWQCLDGAIALTMAALAIGLLMPV